MHQTTNGNLVPFRPTDKVQRRADRAMSRELEGLERSQQLAVARIESQAQIEATRVHAVGYIGQQAMHAVTMVSQLEGQLAQLCPLATTRLQGIADITAFALAQVVSDSVRRLR